MIALQNSALLAQVRSKFAWMIHQMSVSPEVTYYVRGNARS